MADIMAAMMNTTAGELNMTLVESNMDFLWPNMSFVDSNMSSIFANMSFFEPNMTSIGLNATFAESNLTASGHKRKRFVCDWECWFWLRLLYGGYPRKRSRSHDPYDKHRYPGQHGGQGGSSSTGSSGKSSWSSWSSSSSRTQRPSSSGGQTWPKTPSGSSDTSPTWDSHAPNGKSVSLPHWAIGVIIVGVLSLFIFLVCYFWRGASKDVDEEQQEQQEEQQQQEQEQQNQPAPAYDDVMSSQVANNNDPQQLTNVHIIPDEQRAFYDNSKPPLYSELFLPPAYASLADIKATKLEPDIINQDAVLPTISEVVSNHSGDNASEGVASSGSGSDSQNEATATPPSEMTDTSGQNHPAPNQDSTVVDPDTTTVTDPSGQEVP